MNITEKMNYILDCSKQYFEENNIKSLVLGISGGIDSAVVAALMSPVAAELNIPLLGVSLPIKTNTQEEIDRSIAVGQAFCDEFIVKDLSEIYECVSVIDDTDIGKPTTTAVQSKIRHGNIKARLRMIYLYNLAHKNNGLVLSTDNKTEELLGFWTLHGDVGDFGPIQSLWKGEVYQVAQQLIKTFQNMKHTKKMIDALQMCIDAIPTDGLGITSSDLDQLQAPSYSEVDRILKDYIFENDTSLEDHPVICRYKNTEYKRNNPYNILFKE